MMIYVFGSNLAGRHGAGSAAYARQEYGAIYGNGEGLQNSSYAIPTKDKNLKSLSIQEIKLHIEKFLLFAKENPELLFIISNIGCGLAGYKPEDVAPLFKGASNNCYFSVYFSKYI